MRITPVLVALVLASRAAVGQPSPPADDVAPALIGRTLFDERLPGGIAGGEGRQVNLRQVSIEPRRRDIRIDNLPETGMLLAQLQAGGLATVINGERRIRLEGEWWTVSPPSAMRLETRDDTVVIDLVLILD